MTLALFINVLIIIIIILRPHYGGGSLRNIAIPFGMEKLEWCGYQMVKKLDIFIRFDMIHERDRQQTHTETDRQAYTERQAPHDGIGRAYA